MRAMINHPLLVFGFSFVAQWLAAQAGNLIRQNIRPVKEDERNDFGVVQAATLTLLGLIIGFSFSMAVSRYDQRKNDEEAEANAIGTEYVRADLLPAGDAAKVRELLKKYIGLRMQFYTLQEGGQLEQVNHDTGMLQKELWAAVQAAATVQPSPVVALAVAGMNDVLNSQGYTQAAWWNRIPIAAWMLMAAIALCSNLLIGYGARRSANLVFLILPLAVGISFFLISDIDSPRGGVIRVRPQNLASLADSLRG
jgi:hypothetical protein